MTVEELYTEWLNKKLGSFDIEDEVMGSYISSIITTDDAEAEKLDFLKDVLGDLVQGVDIDQLCAEIMNKWNECYKKSAPDIVPEEQLDLGSKVALIMEKQVQPVLKQANRSTEEEQLREAILTRCTFVSSDEEDYDSDEGAASSFQPSAQNQNVESVIQAEKERREVMKTESDKKKAGDKVNREKQKQKQDERKEKERKRTQKQEKRR